MSEHDRSREIQACPPFSEGFRAFPATDNAIAQLKVNPCSKGVSRAFHFERRGKKKEERGRRKEKVKERRRGGKNDRVTESGTF